MKMLAMLAGELTISNKYFLPFANVSLADCRDMKGTFELKVQTSGSHGIISKELMLPTMLMHLRKE